jgi:hypothetical protein
MQANLTLFCYEGLNHQESLGSKKQNDFKTFSTQPKIYDGEDTG